MFNSIYRKVWNHSKIEFPEFTGERIMMMPVELGYLSGIPDQYYGLLSNLYDVTESRFIGKVGYLTIDEQELQPEQTLRRSGLHVDGYYKGLCGAWGGGGGWGSVGNGMLTISSTSHCKAYLGVINGEPKDEGGCDHLTMPNDGEVFESGEVYWVDGACVHESLPVQEKTKRQFVRLSMPSNGPWFEGYTEEMKDSPTKAQWKKVKAKVKDIDGSSVWHHYTPYWTNWTYTPSIGIGSTSGGTDFITDATHNSSNTMYMAGKTDFQTESTTSSS